jgi:hypothetical protein
MYDYVFAQVFYLQVILFQTVLYDFYNHWWCYVCFYYFDLFYVT